MHVTLIVNPVASSVTRRALVVIKKAISADHDLTVEETTRKGQAIRLAHGAARGGADVVVALGGDGTINEVVNGVLDDDCMVAPLPGGSTNVFARAVGYPNDAVEATAVLLEALAARSERPASVGLANGRAFLFHVGVGFDAEVVDRVEQRGHLKRYMGHPYFMAMTVATWLRPLSGRRPSFSVRTADGRRIDKALLTIALNTTPYTYLGATPLHLAPEASLSSPLSMAVLTSLSPRMVPILIAATRRATGLADRRGAHHWADVTEATVTGGEAFHYQLDGEALDPVTELRLEHRPEAIRLVVPVGEPAAPAA
ncbi:MAG: diacylglycerol kinase family protein [Actinomycetota bacterium]